MTARFEFFPAPSGQGYLLDGLNTRVVVPVLPVTQAPRPAAILNPVFDIVEQPHVLVTQFMSAVPTGLLRHSAGSLAADSDRITRAPDFLYQGF